MSKCSPHDEKQLRCQLNIQKAVKRGGTVAKWSKHYHSMKKAMRNLILIHLAACKALENQLAMKFSIKILRRSNQRRIITYLPTDTQFGLIHFSFIYNSSLHMHIFWFCCFRKWSEMFKFSFSLLRSALQLSSGGCSSISRESLGFFFSLAESTKI